MVKTGKDVLVVDDSFASEEPPFSTLNKAAEAAVQLIEHHLDLAVSVTPMPELLSVPHCRTCMYWTPKDERGPLWSEMGVCKTYPVPMDTNAKFWCKHFLFNETLRDAK